MKNTHKGKTADLHRKSQHSDRVVALINRIHRNQLRCIEGNEANAKRLKSIERDVDIIAREVARQAKQGKSNA